MDAKAAEASLSVICAGSIRMYNPLNQQFNQEMESIINTRIPEFSVQAYHKGNFETETDKDVLGKWAEFFF